MTWHMFPGLELYFTDPARHITAIYRLSTVYDLYDLYDLYDPYDLYYRDLPEV